MRLLILKIVKIMKILLQHVFLRWMCYRHSGPTDLLLSDVITLVGQDRQILTVRAQASPNYRGGLDAFRYSPVFQVGRHTETAL